MSQIHDTSFGGVTMRQRMRSLMDLADFAEAMAHSFRFDVEDGMSYDDASVTSVARLLTSTYNALDEVYALVQANLKDEELS